MVRTKKRRKENVISGRNYRIENLSLFLSFDKRRNAFAMNLQSSLGVFGKEIPGVFVF